MTKKTEFTQHHITISYPESYTWEDIRKELKPMVDLRHRLYEQECDEIRQAARHLPSEERTAFLRALEELAR